LLINFKIIRIIGRGGYAYVSLAKIYDTYVARKSLSLKERTSDVMYDG